MLSKEPWWNRKGLKIVEIKKSIYQCHCPWCNFKFEVPEDLPTIENLYGLDVIIVYCPICGRKLRFSIEHTPTRYES